MKTNRKTIFQKTSNESHNLILYSSVWIVELNMKIRERFPFRFCTSQVTAHSFSAEYGKFIDDNYIYCCRSTEVGSGQIGKGDRRALEPLHLNLNTVRILTFFQIHRKFLISLAR